MEKVWNSLHTGDTWMVGHLSELFTISTLRLELKFDKKGTSADETYIKMSHFQCPFKWRSSHSLILAFRYPDLLGFIMRDLKFKQLKNKSLKTIPELKGRRNRCVHATFYCTKTLPDFASRVNFIQRSINAGKANIIGSRCYESYLGTKAWQFRIGHICRGYIFFE